MTDTSKKQDNLLSVEDIFRGGDDSLERLEIDELQKGGRPGVVYLRPLPAGEVLDFADKSEGEGKNQALLEMIAKAVVHPDGSPMFGEEDTKRLREISIGAFNRLAKAVTKMADVGVETAGETEAKNA
jgi:hypothetical protein